jgi:hypothetical protein
MDEEGRWCRGANVFIMDPFFCYIGLLNKEKMCLIEMQCNLIGPSFVENYMEIYEFDRLYVICFYSSKDASLNSREVIYLIKFFIFKIPHIWNPAVSKYLIF